MKLPNVRANEIAKTAYAKALGVSSDSVIGGFRQRHKLGRPRGVTDDEIAAALEAAGGNQHAVALMLGITDGALSYRIKSLKEKGEIDK